MTAATASVKGTPSAHSDAKDTVGGYGEGGAGVVVNAGVQSNGRSDVGFLTPEFVTGFQVDGRYPIRRHNFACTLWLHSAD